MKIYTGSGDRGKTSLFSGERVGKDNDRIEAYGDLDELNAVLGALCTGLPETPPDQRAELQAIQADLFRIGAWLATTPGAPETESLPPLHPGRSVWLEGAIDRMEEDLPPLTAFILPGGHPSAAWAHVARTVCRRVERRVVRLAGDSPSGETEAPLGRAMIYLNRLSDYLFVFARHCNRRHGIADTPWKA
jgi:cob(I)alamin adenosyltransferase